VARAAASDPRFDFRGGVNTALAEDLLDARELRSTQDGRAVRGALTPRKGSKRVHVTALPGGAPLGLRQWTAPGGLEVVAIAVDGLYHKLTGDAEFTKVASVWDATKPVEFAEHRVGAAIVLYIANGVLRQWDGAALTTIANGAPNAQALAIYLGRGFASDGTKRAYGSKIQDLTNWAPGNGGLFADVETYDTDPIVGLAKVGSSLAIAKPNSVARFAGVDPNDVRLDTGTRGISSQAGLRAPRTLLELEQGIFGLSERGPWVASEANLDLTIGEAIMDQFEALTAAARDGAIACHHPTRREVWLWLGAVCWAWHYDTRTWHGPWTGMAATSACLYRRADGTETILRGAADGFVREEDAGDLDDVHRDGTGGTAIILRATLPQLTFGDPEHEKLLDRRWQELVADLPNGASCSIEWTTERSNGVVVITPAGAGTHAYPWKPRRAKGVRFTVTIAVSGAGTKVLAIALAAAIGGRVTG
jgi:hypothetical protein